MSDTIVVGVVAGMFGVLAAAIPAYLAQRKQPSRLTTDAVSLVDASGTVVSNLTEEIERLEKLNARLAERIAALEEALVAAGINPLTIR